MADDVGWEARMSAQPGARQNGKTTALYEEMLTALKRIEEAQEAEKLVLICHIDEEERVRAAVDAAARAVFMPRRIEVVASPYAPKGCVMAYEPGHLGDVLKPPAANHG